MVSRPKTIKAPGLLLNLKLTWRPLLSGGWKQLDTAFYGVGGVNNSNQQPNLYRKDLRQLPLQDGRLAPIFR
jgi:hypothetical protein